MELQVEEVGSLSFSFVGSERISFPALTKTTTGEFIVRNCYFLTSLDFPSLETVFTGFRITDNDRIGDLDRFLSLTNIGQASTNSGVDSVITISNNPFLMNINGLSSVTSTVISLQIESNDRLTSLSGLENAQFNGAISISFNNDLNRFLCHSPIC